MRRRKKRRQLSKRQIYYWLYRIYQFLRSNKADALFKKLIGDDGECTMDDERKKGRTYFEVKINPWSGDFFRTVIHECIHGIKWNLPHHEVYWLENQLVRKMSTCQFAHLLTAFADAIERHYKKKRR